MREPLPLTSALLAFVLTSTFVFTSPLFGADLYVSPDGNDVNAGTADSPLASLARAKALARPVLGKETVTVHVADGTYYLPETLAFEPGDSGTQEFPVVYRAANEGGAILSGGTRLELVWQAHRDGVFVAKTPTGLTIDQLFIDGQNQRMARYPNFDAAKKTAAYQGFSADAFAKSRADGWANPVGGYIHAMHRSRWGGYHYRITGKDSEGEVTYEGGWQNNRQMGMHDEFRMVENIFEELDAPGEWFHDPSTQSLYYMPFAGTDLHSATVDVVRLRHLIEFRGTEEKPVRFIALQGFVIRHAARTFMDTSELMLRSDWAIYRGGSIVLTGTEDVQILDTEFDQVGGNAVFVSNYNRRALVKGCHIHDVGASGVCFVGDPDAVRDPLFGYGRKNDLSKIDRTPGPKTNNYPADSRVEDCLIHGIGRVERQPAGVQIEMASRITVRDCSVYDCARAGLNVGDGAWGGHLIEGCDVFDTVLETHDHGSFNSWGRDRYWRSDHLTASQAAVDKDPTLPFLDAVETTVIRNNRFRCDHGWDIDLDDGSSNYDIYNNLLLSGGLKLREGFRRRAWNNITVNNGLHPHVWFNHSDDEVFGNIFMSAPKGARMPSETAKGKRVDGNLYFSNDPSIKDVHAKYGWDVHSIVADPGFVNPKAGDFRVADDSPALQIGFANFPMDQFGVKKPSLRAIAETPVIPTLTIVDAESPERRTQVANEKPFTYFWLGAKLTELTGEAFSAFGVSKEAGGVALSDVKPTSDAARSGLKDGDLIQGINGSGVKRAVDLLAVFQNGDGAPVSLKLVRDQQAMELVIEPTVVVSFESSETDDGFSTLVPEAQTNRNVDTNLGVKESPTRVLVDGKLNRGYGPVFPNGVTGGIYRMDLGSPQSVTAITSWTSNVNGIRGAQKYTLYGSRADKDPGWDVDDASRFTAIGSVDTTSVKSQALNAVSVRAKTGSDLGEFRWVVWRTSPVSPRSENSAFQELNVQTAP
ncbi:hypothetical protein Poly51_54650 [Rubripirellula tenax]|uniref:PDZ domain-containing protein n=1 Tax=Rubripirellula tenax TaxID=2528015 RepID=A0A5C6EBH8_9BACT|nr:PDZ domain-containing protein [Rubripirellula tenax]TWU46070.1 hypothetical protein Poly51_54650 [Rubripirellula tenax]